VPESSVGTTFARAQQAEAVNREIGLMLSRRFLLIRLSTTALVAALAISAGSAVAADMTVTIGLNLSFTGPTRTPPS